MMLKVHMDIFLEAFENTKKKIVWKHDSPQNQFPEHILALENCPQNNILKHKNVVLFITTGGVSSIQEAIHYAVPMVVIPFSGDQVNLCCPFSSLF